MSVFNLDSFKHLKIYVTFLSSSEASSSDEDESRQHINDSQLATSKECAEFSSFESLFPSMKEVYGTQPEYPKRNDVVLYKKWELRKIHFYRYFEYFEIKYFFTDLY